MIRGLPVALTGWSPGRTRGASGGIRETITRRSRSAAGASGDAWRTRTTSGKMVSGSALGTGVTFRRMVRQGGVSAEASKGGIRHGFGLVPEGLSVGLRGHVSASERSPEGVVLRLVSKKGLPERASPAGGTGSLD